MATLVFVDCEAYGGCPRTGQLTEFGAVIYPTREKFHGRLPEIATDSEFLEVFQNFYKWLGDVTIDRPVLVSDNPAFDWQWINDGFWRTLGHNPFGHSARRISDFYAGLVGDFSKTQSWKRLRVTKHDHNPVHDALGNLEAFERLLKGER